VHADWQENAANSARAQSSRPPATPGASGMLAASDDTVLAAATLGSAKSSSDDSDQESQFKRVKIAPAADLSADPGPDASTEEIVSWLALANAEDKSVAWMLQKLEPASTSGANAALESLKSDGSGDISIQAGDFDGDGERDLAVSIANECADDACAAGPPWTVGVVWAGDQWTRLLQSEARAVEFLAPADLSGDGVPDLVVALETCGAHTCLKEVRAYSVQPSNDDESAALSEIFNSRKAGKRAGDNFYPSQEVRILAEYDPARLALSGAIFGSVGAGPFQRKLTTIWQWSTQTNRLEESAEIWEKSNLRLHKFHDALVYLSKNQPEKAKEALDRVVNDAGLQELPDALSGDTRLSHRMRRQLAQAARFELARIALAKNDLKAFDEIKTRLESKTPSSPAAAATIQLGKVFKATDNAAAACKTAVAEFPEKPDDSWVLDSIQLGYNSPVKFNYQGLCVGL
jgi:hypothetical protein